jgi:hypothetical protein
MRWKFDTPFGRELYSRRMGTVEPVFANKGMPRFTLRGKKKVSAQWKLFTMVHNIEKVAGAAVRRCPRAGQRGSSLPQRYYVGFQPIPYKSVLFAGVFSNRGTPVLRAPCE